MTETDFEKWRANKWLIMSAFPAGNVHIPIFTNLLLWLEWKSKRGDK